MLEKSKLKRFTAYTNGKRRILYTYSEKNPEIKKQHQAYASFLSKHFIPSLFSHAYTKKRSIYTNAKMHLLNGIFIKIDVKNFFPSINHNHLIESLYYELNRKRPNTISLSECKEIVGSSSLRKIGLPLGLIPSPILSNIYMKKFDNILYGRLKGLNLTNVLYTRYADDIFISFKLSAPRENLTHIFDSVLNICSEELNRCHLHINPKKTKLIDLSVSNHAKLAGVNVTTLKNKQRQVTVGRKVVRDLYFKATTLRHTLDLQGNTDEFSTQINSIMGMQSFILSIEKTGYSHRLSPGMKKHIHSLGYNNLEDLISSLDKTQTLTTKNAL